MSLSLRHRLEEISRAWRAVGVSPEVHQLVRRSHRSCADDIDAALAADSAPPSIDDLMRDLERNRTRDTDISALAPDSQERA